MKIEERDGLTVNIGSETGIDYIYIDDDGQLSLGVDGVVCHLTQKEINNLLGASLTVSPAWEIVIHKAEASSADNTSIWDPKDTRELLKKAVKDDHRQLYRFGDSSTKEFN